MNLYDFQGFDEHITRKITIHISTLRKFFSLEILHVLLPWLDNGVNI